MKLEWDEGKASLNLRKHGIAFKAAAYVFHDPLRLEVYDGREDYGEERWNTIGFARSAVVHVTYTIRHGDTIRIISARRANARERKQYREAHD